MERLSNYQGSTRSRTVRVVISSKYSNLSFKLNLYSVRTINYDDMKDITLLNIKHKVKISFSPSFTPKIGNLAEHVRLEGPKK